MKKLFGFFLIYCVLFSVKANSQVYELSVKNIQNFEHPIMKTNDAIRQNKIVYIDAGTTNSSHIFDLDKMKLFRNANGITGEFDIIEKSFDKCIFSATVKFTNGQFANYTYQKESEKNFTLYCRWLEGDKISGWFDTTLK